MAKRRKEKDEQEDKPFKIPKFDEKEFLKKERRNIKSTFLAGLFGIVMAFVCFGFWVLMSSENDFRWGLVLILAIVDAIFLRKIYDYFKLDYSDFTRKNWFTSYAIYFFTWLIIFIVIVNPPIYDDEDPQVNIVAIPEMQEFGGNIKITGIITDNTGVEKSNIDLIVDGVSISSDSFSYENNAFEYIYAHPANLSNETTYTYQITATDSSGRQSTKEGFFTFSQAAITIPDPLDVNIPPGPRVGSATSIKFKVGTNVTRLYYTVNDGDPINVTDMEGEFYITYPKYEGWPKNTNATMKVYAETKYSLPIATDKLPDQMTDEELEKFQIKIDSHTFNNTITDSQTYYFQVADETGVGIEDSPEAPIPKIETVMIPGFETIVFLVSLLIVILIFKYRKKDRR